MTKFVLPRVILGNRGDLASRWGVLHALNNLGVRDATVFAREKDEIPQLSYPNLPYAPMHNLLQGTAGWSALSQADIALWAVGLDFQDDSSLTKLIYLWITFHLYKILGLRIWILFQGAGPLTTPMGIRLARSVLKTTELFAARDPGTFRLIGEICPSLKRVQAYDAIFLPGFENAVDPAEKNPKWFNGHIPKSSQPLVGFNVRQWFHFASSILPYGLAKQTYQKRSEIQMEKLIESSVRLVRLLRNQLNVRVLLISAYQPGLITWEDDLNWLKRIKTFFEDDEDVLLIDQPMTLPNYFRLISRLNLMIAMRLHSTLIAFRLGVPSINISYTLKGMDIIKHLELDENVFDLEDFILSPNSTFERAGAILADQDRERQRIQVATSQAIRGNMRVLQDLLEAEENCLSPI